MDVSGQLISRIVNDARITEVIKSGITEDFLDSDNSIVYKHVLRHYNEYKSVPSRDVILRAFPNYDFRAATEPLEYYIRELKNARKKSIIEDKLQQAARVYRTDTDTAEKYIRECLGNLQIAEKSFKDINFRDSVDDIIEEYDQKKANPGVDGIRSGWGSLDNETLGWQPGEFIVLVGEKYMGKSWAMIYLAAQAAYQGEVVTFVTREMSQTQVRRRLASILAHVPFDDLRKGTLSNAEEERFRDALSKLDKNFHFYIAQNGVYTIDDMEQRAIETDATILFADSVYLFQPDSRKEPLGEVPKRLAISQKCKGVAQNLKIPFVVSVQAGRRQTKKMGPPDLDSIEWSNAFSQDGDTVLYVQKDDVDRELGRSQVWLLKSRDGQLADFYINQDFMSMDFSQRADKREATTQVFEDDEETLYN